MSKRTTGGAEALASVQLRDGRSATAYRYAEPAGSMGEVPLVALRVELFIGGQFEPTVLSAPEARALADVLMFAAGPARK